jgi:arylsulfatase A-like enzyme
MGCWFDFLVYPLAGYYAMIENLDWNYGRVVEALETDRAAGR